MIGGGFGDQAGREVDWELVEVHDYDGGVYPGYDATDHLRETDRAFYRITVAGDTYYRWVAGPFESEWDLGAAIEDEADFYSAIDTDD